jgi:hypothetical protein
MRARIKTCDSGYVADSDTFKQGRWYTITALDPFSKGPNPLNGHGFFLACEDGSDAYCLQYGCAHLSLANDGEWELDLTDPEEDA